MVTRCHRTRVRARVLSCSFLRHLDDELMSHLNQTRSFSQNLMTLSQKYAITKVLTTKPLLLVHSSFGMSGILKRGLNMAQDALTTVMHGIEPNCTRVSFLDCVDRDMLGNEINMSSFKGSVLIVVNVASK
jgi:hypothetical protein